MIAAVALAVAPVIWAAWSATRSGYVPTGDDAVIGVRSADVLSANSPALGMPSGTGAWTGREAYHPGPMVFWAYAPFVRLLGPALGLMVGVAAIGTAAIVGVAVTAFRRGGTTIATLSMIATAVCYWTTGGPIVLFLPLNPFVALLPFWCFLFLSWGVAARDWVLLPWWILTASFVLQADLAYLPGVGLVTVAVVGSLLWSERADRAGLRRPSAPRVDPLTIGIALQLALVAAVTLSVAQGSTGTAAVGAVLFSAVAVLLTVPLPGGGPLRPSGRRGQTSSSARWSIAVVVACWAVPVAQAMVTGGENLRSLAAVAGVDLPTQGLAGAVRAVRLLAAGPVRSTGHLEVEEFVGAWRLLDYGLLLVLIAGAVATHRLASRAAGGSDSRHHRVTVVAGAAAVAAIFAAAQVPLIDGFKHYYYFSLTATAAFVWFGVAVVLWPSVRSFRHRTPPWFLVLVVALGVPATAAMLGSAGSRPVTSSDYEAWHRDALPELATEIEATVVPDSTYELVASGGPGLRVLENGLWGQLLDRGYDLRTHILSNYYGAQRSATSSNPEPSGVLWLLPAGLAHPPADATPVAAYRPDGYDPAAVDQLATDIARHVRRQGDLRLAAVAEYNMAFILYGHVPGMCPTERSVFTGCDTGEEYFDDPDRLLNAPPDVLLDAYRSGYVEWPALTPDLETDLQDLLPRPVTVWLGPAGVDAR